MNEFTVHVSCEIAGFVNQLLASGRYDTVDEVFTDGLRLLQDAEHLRRIHIEEYRKLIAVGLAECERGETAPLDMAEVKRLGRELLAQKRSAANGTATPHPTGESGPR